MSEVLTPSLSVQGRATIRRWVELPIAGEALVRPGQLVKAEDVVLKAMKPGELVVHRLADELGVDPSRIPKHLKVAPGDSVRQGDLLAEVGGLFGFLKISSRSKVQGIVDFFVKDIGHLGIRQAPKEIQACAYIDGTVVEIESQSKVCVETEGCFIQGILGVGGKRAGEIQIFENLNNLKSKALVVHPGMVDAEILEAAKQAGIAALVAGSIDDMLLSKLVGKELGVAVTGDEDIPFTLIITEGFGNLLMANSTYSLLVNNQGLKASCDGATQVRAGAIRPEIIIPGGRPLAEGKRGAVRLQPEAKVRIIRHPYFGLFGRVAEVPSDLKRLITGAHCRVVRVRLDSNQEEVYIPRANIELVEE